MVALPMAWLFALHSDDNEGCRRFLHSCCVQSTVDMHRRSALSAQNRPFYNVFYLWNSQERRRLGDDVIHLDPFTVVSRAAVLALANVQLVFAHSHLCFRSFVRSLAYPVHEVLLNKTHSITSDHIIGIRTTRLFVSGTFLPQSFTLFVATHQLPTAIGQSITKTSTSRMESAISSTAPSPERPRAARSRRHASPLLVRNSASPFSRQSSTDRSLAQELGVLPT